MIPTPPVTAGDSALAVWSFWLLVAVSVFHIIWLGAKNVSIFNSIAHQSLIGTGYIILFGIIIVCILLNFLPVILAIRPWKREKFTKQIAVSIISFIICQALLHVIFVGILGTFGAVGC